MTRARLIQGNEACAEGALAAGCRFFAGYPITPSTEVAEVMAARLPRLGGKFIQMEDEISGMAATIGGALAGMKSMTATSGPGYSLKVENIGFAAMCEVPCVIVNVQRSGPSTGGPTAAGQADIMQARWGSHGDFPIVAFMPYSVRDTFDLTVTAFNCSEDLRVPAVVLLDEVIGHMRERVELPEAGAFEVVDRRRPDPAVVPPEAYLPYDHDAQPVPMMADFGSGYRYHVTGLHHIATGAPTNRTSDIDRLVRRLNAKMELASQRWLLYEEFMTEDADVLLIAGGSPVRPAKRAVRMAREQGIKAGLFIPRTIWPFPEARVRELAQRVGRIIVPELNLGQMALEVERLACTSKGPVPVRRVGRVDGELFTPAQIHAAIREAC
jgi:2-oxoglutarate ferredoxin oxidoreductase subunit alpha